MDHMGQALRSTPYELRTRRRGVVSSRMWLARLMESEESEGSGDSNGGRDVVRNPAIKLLDFYSRDLWLQEGQSAVVQQTPMAVGRSVGRR
ncbi:hypothetical protein F4779DRAFT_624557 [Xylariaceae sp. FL0662B]|nr:hypothetical protein F4779DRAFT_624557 [Xylariaceae sp. FL0662B]